MKNIGTREIVRASHTVKPGVVFAMRRAPEHFETERLLLRRPIRGDADSIFARYANDSEVTRYLGWPRHESVEQTQAFLEFSDSEWARWPAGPYLIHSRGSGALLGSTGFAFETLSDAMTGYVLARDAWGKGFATEALSGLMSLTANIALRRVGALCHVDHVASQRVLAKCGFHRQQDYRKHLEYPNLVSSTPQQTHCYSRCFE